jgi:hypothetical protein
MNNTNRTFNRSSLGCALALAIMTIPHAAIAQPKIQGISVLSSQPVQSPATAGNTSINEWPIKGGVLASLADEHSTIFPPGTLPGHEHDYLFFVPPGIVVLTDNGTGPDRNGVWTLDFAHDYDDILLPPPGAIAPQIVLHPPISPDQQIFGPPLKGQCPPAQDTTFDLNYAAAGSVILDPTRERSTQLLMIYEGTTQCLNVPGGTTQNGSTPFYAALGVATSEDFGKLWPVYRTNMGSATLGPDAPAPVAPPPPQDFGDQVCVGENWPGCYMKSPSTYGRYPVISHAYSMQGVLASNTALSSGMGEQAPSAFVDDVHPGPETFVYVVHGSNCPGKPKAGDPPDPNYEKCKATGSDMPGLKVARALLSGSAPLEFEKWNGSFPAPGTLTGIGGPESPILPAITGAYAFCQDPSQKQLMGSISYVQETNEYLLTFVCETDSASQQSGGTPGRAWYFSTLDASLYDLSRQDKWSTPKQIAYSWTPVEDTNCLYDGWYPSFMSLGTQSGRLSTTGYAFSMSGCTDSYAGQQRQYVSRVFNMSLQTPPCTNPIECCVKGRGTWNNGQCQ